MTVSMKISDDYPFERRRCPMGEGCPNKGGCPHRYRSTPGSPPSLDGFLRMESSDTPVPYHVSSCCGPDSIDAVQVHALVMSAARIACMSADIMRGQLPAGMLKRAATASCLKKLETMAHLLEHHMRTHPEIRVRLKYFPVIPHMLSGMFVSPTKLEISAHLTIGKDHYWSNLILKQVGCRWLCTMSDIG
ncbi:hypothetical protein [Bifidobacterium leontopitheci]|uniref:Uncharacterized protein n=1 Tax=Bifidobacterium leontopitheci TaxID=2650774 RepID=A0A6I1GNQ6_9BIFI|nr:hypothetical protein [Bifidobacterium leontopitheci]KAB7791019.1 hypothetical protein F7D09_0565 [Bifidobacterium leontopitheci]